MQILALHGFTGSGSDFSTLSQSCGGDWHCPDLPGHGPDPMLDCSPQATLDFINDQLSTLNSQPSVLMGYSMGARAALLHAIHDPKNWAGLILISPNPGIEDDSARTQRRLSDADLADRIEREGVPAFLDYWQKTPMIRSQQNNIPTGLLESMQRKRLEHQAAGLANSLRQFGQGNMPNLWPELPKLNMPVCILTGEQDEKYTQIANRMIAIQGEHTVIPNVGHMPHLENLEYSAIAINRFLEQI